MRLPAFCLAALSLTMAAGGGCANRLIVPTRLFGPVASIDDSIAGRVGIAPNQTMVLLLERGLVEVDIASRTFATHPLPKDLAKTCWGLGVLPDRTLWTLEGAGVLLRLDENGQPVAELPLRTPHLGLFSHRGQLLYLKATTEPSLPVIESGPPGNADRRPWGALRTRALPVRRGAAAALNIVSCGESDAAERPCWFPEETTLALISDSGSTRMLRLPGFEPVTPDVLLNAVRPSRPIRDVRVDSSGNIWVVGSDAREDGLPRGGTLLAKYTNDGRLVFRERMARPARLILGVLDNRVILLGGDGYVLEARP